MAESITSSHSPIVALRMGEKLPPLRYHEWDDRPLNH